MFKNIKCMTLWLCNIFFGYLMFKNIKCMTYDGILNNQIMSLCFLLCSAHIRTKDHINICLKNSRTCLIVFFTNVGIDLIYR